MEWVFSLVCLVLVLNESGAQRKPSTRYASGISGFGIQGFQGQQGGFQGNFGGFHGGFGGSSGGHGGNCKNYCEDQDGQYRCCKPGKCPIVRDYCQTKNYNRPPYCNYEFDCGGYDKCCQDACVGLVCKPPVY